MTELEIILNFVWKTFLNEIKFDRKISNLIRNIFTLVRPPPLVKSLINLPGNYETAPDWNLDYTWIRVWLL